MSVEPLNAAHDGSASGASTAPSRSGLRDHEPSMEEILASIRRIIADDQSLPTQDAHRDPLDDADLRGTLATRSAVDLDAPQLAPVRIVRPAPLYAEAPASDEPLTRPKPADEPQHVESLDRAPVMRPPLVDLPLVDLHTRDPHPTDIVPADDRRAWPQPPATAKPSAEARVASPRHSEEEDVPGSIIPPPAEPPPAALHADDLSDPCEYDDPIGAGPSPVEPDASMSGLLSAATGQSLASSFNMLAATRLADNSDELLAMTRDMIRPILKTWLDDNLPSMVERLVRAEIERVSRGGR